MSDRWFDRYSYTDEWVRDSDSEKLVKLNNRNSFLVSEYNKLENQLKDANEVIEQCLYHTAMRDPDVNTHKQSSDSVESITREYLTKYKGKE